jgi:aconitase A
VYRSISRVEILLQSGLICDAGLATVANMGAEVGATTSTFPYTPRMRAYLEATHRSPVARAADEAAAQGFLSPDDGAEYDEIINIVMHSGIYGLLFVS